MRRIVLPFTIAAAALLAACSGGGSVLSTGGSAAQNVIITPGTGSYNLNTAGVFAVRQGQALVLHAQGVANGTNGVVNPGFTWSVAYTPTGTYQNNSAGQTAACAPITTVPNPQPSPSVAPTNVTYTLPASSLVVSPEDSSYATFTPPLLPAPATGTAYANQSYCAIVSASANSGGGVGSATVAVSP